MRIVYVEDNIANVHLVKRVARMGKHEVINYIDGMDAFNNFATDNPDLVLMDIQLAGELTGIEVVKKLRDKGFQAPIYAVTAYAMVGDRERCMEAGCTGYISKPIPIPDLVKLFAQYDKPEQPVATIKLDKTVYDVNETKKLLSAKTFIEDNNKDTVTKDSEPVKNTTTDISIDLAETKTLVAAQNITSVEAVDDAPVSQKSDNIDNTKSDSSVTDKVKTQSAKPVNMQESNQDPSLKPVKNKTSEDSDITPVAEFDNDDTISMNKDEPAQMI